MKHKTGRKLLSFLLTLAMLVGLMPGMGLTAKAESTSVTYLDASGNPQTTSATPVTNSDTTWSTGWYVVNSSLTNENRITVNGTVNLILCDGAKLTANAGIAVENDNTLNIYEGWTGERVTTPTVGELSATGGDDAAGIGSKPSIDDHDMGMGMGMGMPTAVTGGNIIINGGTVTATGIRLACRRLPEIARTRSRNTCRRAGMPPVSFRGEHGATTARQGVLTTPSFSACKRRKFEFPSRLRTAASPLRAPHGTRRRTLSFWAPSAFRDACAPARVRACSRAPRADARADNPARSAPEGYGSGARRCT